MGSGFGVRSSAFFVLVLVLVLVRDSRSRIAQNPNAELRTLNSELGRETAAC